MRTRCEQLLAAGDGGVIVNVSSLAARMANGSNVAYCASKAALDNMTASLARALAPGIREVANRHDVLVGRLPERYGHPG